MVSFAKIPDLVGYLVLTEYGAVLESDGDLKNDENCANIVTSIINLADRYAQQIIVFPFDGIKISVFKFDYLIEYFHCSISVPMKIHYHEAIATEYRWFLKITVTPFVYQIRRFMLPNG